MFVFFFFKQKTAYEMRISDWSSDVCSSDLAVAQQPCRGALRRERDQRTPPPPLRGERRLSRPAGKGRSGLFRPVARWHAARNRRAAGPFLVHRGAVPPRAEIQALRPASAVQGVHRGRSEEHTSELQSLMRISYAV